MPLLIPRKDALDDILRTGLGFKSMNSTIFAVGGTGGFATQVIFATGIPLRANTVVSNLWLNIATAAAGTVPTSAFMGIADPQAVVRIVSADLKSSSSWTATGWQSFTLGATYTVPSDGLYYGLILINGTFSVTQPLAQRASAIGAQVGSTFLYATGGTGQSTIPAASNTLTLATTSSPLWYACAVS